MAEKRRFLDVWLVEPNTVYREVPFSVVADWVIESRLLADDMLRPSGTKDWFRVGASPDFSPYIPKPAPFQANDDAEALSAVEFEFAWKRRPEDEDDDVDMIPLIDVSLVLLIFFIMTAAGAISTLIQVPSATKMLRDTEKNMIWVGIELEKDSKGNPIPDRIEFSIGWVDKPTEAAVAQKIKLGADKERFDALIVALKAELEAERARAKDGTSKHVFPVPLTIRADGKIDEVLVRDLTVRLGEMFAGGSEPLIQPKLYVSVTQD